MKALLITILLIVLFASAGGLAGVIGGSLLYDFIPQWKPTTVSSTPSDVIDILFVDYYFTSDDPSEDTLYVKTDTGTVYSIHQGDWASIPPLPNEQPISEIRMLDGFTDSPLVAITQQKNDFQLIDGKWQPFPSTGDSYWGAEPSSCTGPWPGHPPTRRPVIDSAGFVFEHALANAAKCYVLYSDGSIQEWSRTTDAFTLMQTLGMGGLTGAIIGGIVALVIKSRRRANSKKNTTNTSAA